MLNRWTLRKLAIAGLVILLVIAGGWGWFGRRQISGTCFGSQQARVLMPRMFSPDEDEKATPGYRWMGVLPWGGSGEAVLWADTEMRLLGKADLVAKVRSSAAASRDDCRVETVEDVLLGEDAGFLVRGRVGTTRFVGSVVGRRNWSLVACFSAEGPAFARNQSVLESCARTLRLVPP